MPSDFDAMVIGGGLLGATAALFLARGGMRVALFERGPLCREASGTNAGTLTMQMTRVALIPFALEGHAMWKSARDWLGHDVGMVTCDGLSLAFTEQEAELLSDRATKRREAGAPISLLTPEEAQEVEPGISPDILLAGHCPVDGFTAAYETGKAFRVALLEAGVAVYEHTPASRVEAEDVGYSVISESQGTTRGRRLILAGGVWIEPMLAWLGVQLPIKTLVNQLVVTERMAPIMRTVVGIASGLLSLKQYSNGTVLIGGGWQGIGNREEGGYALRPEALIGNVRLACHAIPALRGARLARAWAGLEAETDDALPAVGPVPGHDDAYVCGSVHSGYTSGLAIARHLAAHILGEGPGPELFPIDRLLQHTVPTSTRET
ncbi:MAG: FAD-binding oxidoreductase [Pseudomonadota bacterium]